MNETLKNVVRIILLVWFLAINGFIFVPSFQLLCQAAEPVKTEDMPTPPLAPKELVVFDPKESAADRALRAGIYKDQVAVYGYQVNAYDKQVTAFGRLFDERTRSATLRAPARADAYKLVVKETLSTMVSGFITALLTYVFINAGAQVAHNYMRFKKGDTIEPLKLL